MPINFKYFIPHAIHHSSAVFIFLINCKGTARTQSPTTKNCTLDLSTFGIVAGVSPTAVQWRGLTLEEPPLWPRYPLCQVSMNCSPDLSSICANQLYELVLTGGNNFQQAINRKPALDPCTWTRILTVHRLKRLFHFCKKNYTFYTNIHLFFFLFSSLRKGELQVAQSSKTGVNEECFN